MLIDEDEKQNIYTMSIEGAIRLAKANEVTNTKRYNLIVDSATIPIPIFR